MAKKKTTRKKPVPKPRLPQAASRPAGRVTPPGRKKVAGKLAKSVAKPRKVAATASKPKTTAEDDRGGQFFGKLRVWRIFHDNPTTEFTKQTLAEQYFEDHDEREEWWSRQIRSAVDKKTEREARQGRQRELESRRRLMERQVVALQGADVPIHDLDLRGRAVDRDDRPQKSDSDSRTAERTWKYDPNGRWAKELADLLDTYGMLSYELVGIMACRSLLADLGGVPAVEGVRRLVDTMTARLPKTIREEAIEVSRAWRYSVGNTSKYATALKKAALATWHEATIRRHQVDVTYKSPDKPARTHRVAAFGTKFSPQDNAIYLVGCTKDKTRPGQWLRPVLWKFDRVQAVKAVSPITGNPAISSILPDPRIRAAGGPGPERLDVEQLFGDSAATFFRYGESPIQLEVLVHSPQWIEWCIEKPFHPKQNEILEKDSAGKPVLRLVVDRCNEREIASILLRFGSDFTVVSPPSLIDRIKNTASAILKRHP